MKVSCARAIKFSLFHALIRPATYWVFYTWGGKYQSNENHRYASTVLKTNKKKQKNTKRSITMVCESRDLTLSFFLNYFAIGRNGKLVPLFNSDIFVKQRWMVVGMKHALYVFSHVLAQLIRNARSERWITVGNLYTWCVAHSCSLPNICDRMDKLFIDYCYRHCTAIFHFTWNVTHSPLVAADRTFTFFSRELYF